MENSGESGKIRLPAALILLSAAFYIQGTAIVIFLQHGMTPDEKLQKYLSFFPGFLKNDYMLAAIAFFACTASLILSALSLSKPPTKHRWLAFTCIALSLLTGFLSLFQMM